MSPKKFARRARHERNRHKKLAKKKTLRKRYEDLRNRFPLKAGKPKVKKVGDKYVTTQRPTYQQLLPPSKKYKMTKAAIKAKNERKKKIEATLKKIQEKEAADKLDKDAG
mgnify:CR=1 FL=1